MISNITDLLVEYDCVDTMRLKYLVYKYTDCGAWITHNAEGVCVGATVEGCDSETQPIQVNYPFTVEEYYRALQSVESEATMLWLETHGCEGCAAHWGIWEDEIGEFCEVFSGCKECNGEGITI